MPCCLITLWKFPSINYTNAEFVFYHLYFKNINSNEFFFTQAVSKIITVGKLTMYLHLEINTGYNCY